MIQDNNTNSDICFLVLARPADALSALIREVIAPRVPIQCDSVYDAIATLLADDPYRQSVLITRPSMLAAPHLAKALRQYPNLRLIGWLSPHELDSPAATPPGLSIVTVSTHDELAYVLAAITNAFTGRPLFDTAKQPPEPDKHLTPADYRLSDEELDALLGADK